jgi:putative chitinase
MITLDVLKKLCPKTDTTMLSSFVDPLNTVAVQAQLNGNKNRMAAFLAQTSCESAYFSKTEENLNYSAQGLVNTFSKKFPTLVSAQAYAHQPERIANKVYANRLGNGDEASGDGWRYRGRGVIQLTGKQTYQQYADSIKKSLADTVIYLGTAAGATDSAGWFWTLNKLNKYVDNNDFVGLTRHINSETNGLEIREQQYAVALQALS